MRKVYLDTGRRREKIVYEELEVESTFVQLYVNTNDIFYRLQSPSAYNLLLFALIKMDQFNHILLNKNARSEFISEVSSKGGKKYSDSTIKGAIRELVKSNFLVLYNENNKRESSYMVNPNFFWKSRDQKHRMEAIRAYKFKEIKNEGNTI